MFFGEWQERELEEIPVEDVILEEFVELLNVIYPSNKAVTGKLALFYTFVINRVPKKFI